jgi:hypothetical protein
MDLFRECLAIIKKRCAEQGLTDWEKLIARDLRRWDSRKAVAPFLARFGGVGSINDLAIGDNSLQGIWIREVFGLVKAVAWDYAISTEYNKAYDVTAILQGRAILSRHRCWECESCERRYVTGRLLEQTLASEHLSLWFAEGLVAKDLQFLLDIDGLMERAEPKRAQLLTQLNLTNVQYEPDLVMEFKGCLVCQSRLVRTLL